MQSFFRTICAQTDKTRLVQFALQCSERLTPPDNEDGQALLTAIRQWLKDQSETNRYIACRMATRLREIGFYPTAPYNAALYAAMVVATQDDSSNSPGIYAACVAYTVSSLIDPNEQARQKEIFQELFPEANYLTPTIKQSAETLGKLGGTARAQKLSADKRTTIAKNAAKKRWSKKA